MIIVPVWVNNLHQVIEYFELFKKFNALYEVKAKFNNTSFVVVNNPSQERYSLSMV